MQEDPRSKPYLTPDDILKLNFIRKCPTYVFRRHHRSGLRSHIFQILNRREVEDERSGIPINGLLAFPKARPIKMLRIFRARFRNMKEAEEELARVRTVDRFLAPRFLARSTEFLVDFIQGLRKEPILCGLQEYVEGEIIDPWGVLDRDHLVALRMRLSPQGQSSSESIVKEWIQSVRRNAAEFIATTKDLIMEARCIPDLAGSGNLLLTYSGSIKLVDINNISRTSFDSSVPLDDRGYPVCDKSVEALFLLEGKLLQKRADRKEMPYGVFLDPGRMKEVKALETQSHQSMESIREGALPASS